MYSNFFLTFLMLTFFLISFQKPCLAKDKIALLFLTRSGLNHPNLWKKFLKKSADKYTIYFHSKEPLEDPFFQQHRISKIVPTTWSIHAKAWQALVQEAIKDPDNVRFAFLSESCIPLYSLDYIYAVMIADSRTHMAFATKPWWPANSPRELHTIPPEFRCGNSEWIVMNRKHAEIVAADRAIIRMISRHENDQESYFSTLFALHDCLFDDLCAHSYTYVDWAHPINNGASPHHFTEVNPFNDAQITEAYSSGALFARKFTSSYPENELRRMILRSQRRLNRPLSKFALLEKQTNLFSADLSGNFENTPKEMTEKLENKGVTNDCFNEQMEF